VIYRYNSPKKPTTHNPCQTRKIFLYLYLAMTFGREESALIEPLQEARYDNFMVNSLYSKNLQRFFFNPL
jgi:hypothetical protein